ncbi:hypothetical protein [Thaumasiovibrio sp. DFM-14]|uniref:hypothetical protein n=1 Tax=Thaumasiovibrio sp. DFM-14 TaxID=3384792 RepID=UPI00399FEDAA
MLKTFITILFGLIISLGVTSTPAEARPSHTPPGHAKKHHHKKHDKVIIVKEKKHHKKKYKSPKHKPKHRYYHHKKLPKRTRYITIGPFTYAVVDGHYYRRKGDRYINIIL